MNKKQIERPSERAMRLVQEERERQQRLKPQFDPIRLQAIIAIYAEMVGQVVRQNRNVEQAAGEIARKSIQCADELIKAIAADSSQT